MENSIEENNSEQSIEQVASPQQPLRKKLALFSYLRFFRLIKTLVMIGIIILGLYAIYALPGGIIIIGLATIIGLALYVLYLCIKCIKTEAQNIYLVIAIILGLSVIMEAILGLLMNHAFDDIWILINDITANSILIGLLIGGADIIDGLKRYVLYLFNRTDKNKKTDGKKFIIRGVATIIISIFIIPIFFIAIIILFFTSGVHEVHSFFPFPIPYSLIDVLIRMFVGR